jgi:hypothetical protein
MGFISWLLKSLVLLGVLNFVVLPVMHAVTRNHWFKVPLALLLALPSAVLIAWLDYVPFFLLLFWIALNHHSLAVMQEGTFEAKTAMQINTTLFAISSYSYILVTCLLGWFLQAELVDSAGRAIPLWKHILGIA